MTTTVVLARESAYAKAFPIQTTLVMTAGRSSPPACCGAVGGTRR
jgi:hypothetical protein